MNRSRLTLVIALFGITLVGCGEGSPPEPSDSQVVPAAQDGEVLRAAETGLPSGLVLKSEHRIVSNDLVTVDDGKVRRVLLELGGLGPAAAIESVRADAETSGFDVGRVLSRQDGRVGFSFRLANGERVRAITMPIEDDGAPVIVKVEWTDPGNGE